MKKVLVPLCMIAAMMTFTGCVMAPGRSVVAPLQMSVGSPGLDFVDNSVRPLKSGKATATGIIFFADGNASIKAAMEQGGITKVHHVDYETTNIFGIIASHTVIVWGE